MTKPATEERVAHTPQREMYGFAEVSGSALQDFLNAQSLDGFELHTILTVKWQDSFYYSVVTKRDEHRPIVVADESTVEKIKSRTVLVDALRAQVNDAVEWFGVDTRPKTDCLILVGYIGCISQLAQFDTDDPNYLTVLSRGNWCEGTPFSTFQAWCHLPGYAPTKSNHLLAARAALAKVEGK